MLHSLPTFHHPDVIVGTETSDDAGVFRVRDDLAIVNTVDFFTPIVDDPYVFGQVAAANALSDVYAMGGEPTTALNIVGFPKGKMDISVLLASLGIVFSFGWLCVNRGSKFWQENWEYHVDMLENKINGPLYKVVMTRGKPSNRKESFVHLLTGPSPISVSKINQLISLFVTLMWFGLLWY